ncbi:MAG: hypothetical protein ACMUJM_24535 [bacterium]
MDTNKLLEFLEDQNALIEANAASSAYVMRTIFEATEKLQSFEGRKDLAPAILARIEQLIEKPSNPVFLGACLYALELTRDKPKIRAAVLHVLEKDKFRDDPLIGQLAGVIGFNQVETKKHLTPGTFLTTDELQSVVEALKKEEGQK